MHPTKMKKRLPFLSALVFLSCLMASPLLADDAPKARTAPFNTGDEAPDFTLPALIPGADAESAPSESNISLSSFRGKKKVVLYFYPKDNTPGCTQEATDFTTDYERFKKLGAEVLAVSVDDLASHKNFRSKNKLSIPLLADIGGKVARQYGAMGWIMAKRITYVIDKTGRIEAVFSDVNVSGHSKAVLKAVSN
jgi:peroxiredoxin Q/BCP